jgi:hypothetical protein
LTIKRLATLGSAALILATTAGAQTARFSDTPTLNVPSPTATPALVPGMPVAPTFMLRRGSDRETWHTVMIVSAIFLFAGLVDDDNTLTALGGAGVILSLVEMDSTRFRYASVGRGMDLIRMGNVSVGMNPFGQMGLTQGFSKPHPNLILQARFKF